MTLHVHPKEMEIPQKKCRHCGKLFYEGETLALACYDNVNSKGKHMKGRKLMSHKARKLAMLTLTCPECTIEMDMQFVADQMMLHLDKRFNPKKKT